ncbi:MAG: CPBP family intramembrane metalloprotease [Colwellia sp.]|nr:CPBP family intramembrane metalloprotease [Colwellia sp.]
MLKLRFTILKDVLFYGILCYLSTKVIKALYIFTHNFFEEKHWSYSLLFRNFHIDKNINNLMSPIIYAPVIETLIFCTLIFFVCKKVKLLGWPFILVSAALFSPYHLVRDGAGSLTLMYTFSGGLIFAHLYNRQYIRTKLQSYAYFSTVLAHSISNLFTVYL